MKMNNLDDKMIVEVHINPKYLKSLIAWLEKFTGRIEQLEEQNKELRLDIKEL